MVSSWIPAAEFLSAALIVVCFVIAVVMITLRLSRGSTRTLGVAGVVLVFLAMILYSFTGSLGSAYGTKSTVFVVGSVVVVVVAVVGLSLWITVARKGSRMLTMIGTVLILLGLLGRFVYQWLVYRYLGVVDDATIVSILAAVTAIGGVLTAAGLIVMARAVIVAGWRSSRTASRR
ncbi:hypothetical protein FOE78_21515 [Microlunatus elymi]|uniref:Uncharacterized protein n=1 Tax=Microlunatus elymi TaxID=2596828 RepID=A0A516Q3Y4_9ACTN|nr:hypothetical protein [Microlunatus elymi]QDP98134.1 hypothetical protein FOE78_21515 [Microlunatus elymi]